MNYTHILMPQRVKIIPQSTLEQDQDFVTRWGSSIPYMKEWRDKNPNGFIVFNDYDWNYMSEMRDRIGIPAILKELPKNAQEFPFGVDSTESQNARDSESQPRTMGFLEATMGSELEHTNTESPERPRTFAGDDDEIPF